MSKKMKRDLMILTLFAVGLVLFVINIKYVMQGTWGVLLLFQPLVVGIALAFILNRPCMMIDRFLKKRVFKKSKGSLARGISVAIVFLFVILLAVVFVSIVIPQLIESIQILLRSAGRNAGNLQSILDDATDFLGIDAIDLSSVGTLILESINKWGSSVTALLSQLVSITTGVISFFVTLLISLIFCIYLLLGKENLIARSKKVLSSYLPETVYQKGEYVMRVVIATFDRYVVGQITEAFILGALCFLGMVIFRFDYPLLISILIAATALVPVVGTYIGGFIAFILIFIVSPMKAVWFLVFLVVLQQFEGNVIYPRIVGSSLGLPSILVLLAVIVGGGLAGPAGILLGIPFTAVLYTLLKDDIKNRKETKG